MVFGLTLVACNLDGQNEESETYEAIEDIKATDKDDVPDGGDKGGN